MPSSASAKKIERHPRLEASAPPISGAAPGPTATIRFIIAMRRAASCGKAVSRTMARPITSPAHPPSACSSRATIRLWTSGTSAAARPAMA